VTYSRDRFNIDHSVMRWDCDIHPIKSEVYSNYLTSILNVLDLACEYRLVTPYVRIHDDLLDYNDKDDDTFVYPCRSCEELTEVEEPKEFDPDMHYCDSGPRCCP